jgi:hypothetical protein
MEADISPQVKISHHALTWEYESTEFAAQVCREET